MERWPALIRAATTGDVATLRAALDRGVEPDRTVPTAFGHTDPLLVTAAAYGRLDVVRLLLRAGASPTVETDTGRTPMGVAVERGHLDVVKELVAHGVEPLDATGVDSVLRDALTAAAEDPHTTTLARLETLLDAGVTVASTEESAVVQAIELRAIPAVLRVLFRHGANPNDRRADGTTALMLAAIRDDPASVDTLLQHGADAEATDEAGYTALMRATERGISDVVSILLAHGAEPNLLLPDGTTVVEPLGTLRKMASYRLRNTPTPDVRPAPSTTLTASPCAFTVRGDRGQFEEWSLILRRAGASVGDVWFENVFSWPADEVEALAERLSGADGSVTLSSADLSIVRDAACYLAYRVPDPLGYKDLHEQLAHQLRH